MSGILQCALAGSHPQVPSPEKPSRSSARPTLMAYPWPRATQSARSPDQDPLDPSAETARADAQASSTLRHRSNEAVGITVVCPIFFMNEITEPWVSS